MGEQEPVPPARPPGSESAASAGLTGLTGATAATGGAAATGRGSVLTAGARFGRYTIVRLIGHGGMGAVYEAQQEQPRRSVALKVIRSSCVSPQMLRRFEHESQVLGRLQHPAIAQVFEAGSVKDDQGDSVPFFAMELIQGVTLTEHAAAKRLGTRSRLELMARVCDGVYHAHQKGVIHRDLKPGNILVDESGQPKILDFGVARATDSDIQQTTIQTDIGQIIGTVPYMSPEQVGGNPGDLDTRSDVYALGVIAYEMLAGRLPYDLQKKMIHEAVRVIREEEPTRLSSIDRGLRGDVETIVGRALEKDKTRRYQSAEALGTDIRRYLRDEPIAARPASTWYQAAKFARRNKVLVGGVGTTFVALIAGIVGVSLALGRALRAESDLTEQVGKTTAALTAATVAEGQAVKDRDIARYESYVANLAAASAAYTANQPSAMRAHLDACPEALRGWEWKHLDAVSDASLFEIAWPDLVSAEYSPNGREIAVGFGFCSVTIADARTGEPTRVLGTWDNQIRRAEYSPDGRTLLVSSIYHLVQVVSAMDGRVLADLSVRGVQLWDARFGAGGSRVVAGYGDKRVRVFDSAVGGGGGGKPLLELSGHAHAVTLVAMSADGSRLASADRSGGLRLWDGRTGALVAELREAGPPMDSEVLFMEFSSDGRFFLSGGRDKVARVHEAATGALVASAPPAGSALNCGAFNPDASQFVVAENQGEARVCETASGSVRASLRGYSGTINRLEFNGRGTAVLSAGSDKTARIWHAATGKQIAVLRGHQSSVSTARYSPDGERVLTVSRGSGASARVWDRSAPMGTVELRGHTHIVKDAAFSPDGERVATASRDGGVRVWETLGGKCLGTFAVADGPPPGATSVCFSPDGGTILTGGLNGRVQMIDAQTGAVVRVLQESGGEARSVRFSVGGDVALARVRPRVVGWNSRTGERVFEHAQGDVSAAALHPDGKRLAVMHQDGTTRVVDAASGAVLAKGPRGGVGEAMAFSPDGSLIATGRYDGVVNLWSVADGSVAASWQAHDDRVNGLGFSPDGTRLVTASYDHTARVWDTATRRLLLTLGGHISGLNTAVFSPEGDRIITTANEAVALIHDSVPVRARRSSVAPPAPPPAQPLPAPAPATPAGVDAGKATPRSPAPRE